MASMFFQCVGAPACLEVLHCCLTEGSAGVHIEHLYDLKPLLPCAIVHLTYVGVLAPQFSYRFISRPEHNFHNQY